MYNPRPGLIEYGYRTMIPADPRQRIVLYTEEPPHYELHRLVAWASYDTPDEKIEPLDLAVSTVVPLFVRPGDDDTPVSPAFFRRLLFDRDYYVGTGPVVWLEDVTDETRERWTVDGKRALDWRAKKVQREAEERANPKKPTDYLAMVDAATVDAE